MNLSKWQSATAFMASLALAVIFAGCNMDEDSETYSSSQQSEVIEEALKKSDVAEADESVSDDELRSAAAAYIRIEQSNKEYQQALQEAQDETERRELQDSANQRIKWTIEMAGLSVDRYNAIMQMVQSDDALDERFQENVDELRKASPSS